LARSRKSKSSCLTGGSRSYSTRASTGDGLLDNNGPRTRQFYLWTIGFLFLLLVACSEESPNLVEREPVEVIVSVDGDTGSYTTSAGNVREFLEEVDIPFGQYDIVDPPPFTALTEDTELSIIRVSENIEIIEQTVPFERRTVRNESMGADDPPVIIQSGVPGLQEITVRIVYHDSLEFSRNETQVALIEPAVDEIVMIGVGAAPGSVDFDGILSVISGGNAVIMRGSSAYAELLNTGNDLDYRVFSLAPTGSQLLYTRATTETDRFNSLWAIGTERGDIPRSLGIHNVLWADWNPDQIGELQLAFTTGEFTDIPPGWEANNDLWIGDLPQDRFAEFEPELVIESYPATYGWWGGSYAWSPSGRYIAYSYADEIGIIDTYLSDEDEQRSQLHTFTEFNTRADWVWIPPISWSPDSGYLAFAQHSGDDPNAPEFETWVIDIESGAANRFVKQSGIWSHPSWSPLYSDPLRGNQESSEIAFLKTTNPAESQRSSYTLWLMDRDGSNVRQVYPPAGENSRFPKGGDFMAWGPNGRDIAFVYDESLYFMNLDSGETRRITHDDSAIRNPTWAPYGPSAFELLRFGEGAAGAVLQLTEQEDVPSE
jgi:hypothetical protein